MACWVRPVTDRLTLGIAEDMDCTLPDIVVFEETFPMSKTRFIVTCEVNADAEGANLNGILSAVGRARDTAGIALGYR